MEWPSTKTCLHRLAQDCAVGEWSFWSGCAEPCRPSVRLRVRQIEQQPSHSGERCPSLKEQSGCREYRDHQGKLCGQHSGTKPSKTSGALANVRNFASYFFFNFRSCSDHQHGVWQGEAQTRPLRQPPQPWVWLSPPANHPLSNKFKSSSKS